MSPYFLSAYTDIVDIACRWQIEDENDVPSSVEGYVQALTQGCRCIKIDLVLDETNNFIVGGTLPLQEVLDTIRDFAFAGSFSLSAYRLINYHTNILRTTESSISK